MTILYTTSATAQSGRNGNVVTNDGLLDVALAYPKELGGNGGATNPEQLFAAGYSACFSNAILHVARTQKIDIKDAPTTANVSLKPTATGGFELEVSLSVNLEMDQEAAEALVKTAHQVCPYSNATRGNIDVALEVNGAAIA